MERELIEYNGEMLTIYAIAKKEEISKDINLAIEKYRNKKQKEEDNKQKKETRRKKKESIQDKKQTKDVKKEFLKEIQECKKQTVQLKKSEISIYELSLLIGVRYINLVNLLNEGMSVDEIKNKYRNQEAAENIILKNGQTLLEYCVKNGFDFTFFYRSIVTYKRKASEVVELCERGYTDIPIEWINERYINYFKKLEAPIAQIAAIMYDLRKNRVSLEEALELCTIRKNARKSEIDEEWAEILYSLVKTREMAGDEIHSEIKLDEIETQFINTCKNEIMKLRCKIYRDPAIMQKDEEITLD